MNRSSSLDRGCWSLTTLRVAATKGTVQKNGGGALPSNVWNSTQCRGRGRLLIPRPFKTPFARDLLGAEPLIEPRPQVREHLRQRPCHRHRRGVRCWLAHDPRAARQRGAVTLACKDLGRADAVATSPRLPEPSKGLTHQDLRDPSSVWAFIGAGEIGNKKGAQPVVQGQGCRPLLRVKGRIGWPHWGRPHHRSMIAPRSR